MKAWQSYDVAITFIRGKNQKRKKRRWGDRTTHRPLDVRVKVLRHAGKEKKKTFYLLYRLMKKKRHHPQEIKNQNIFLTQVFLENHNTTGGDIPRKLRHSVPLDNDRFSVYVSLGVREAIVNARAPHWSKTKEMPSQKQDFRVSIGSFLKKNVPCKNKSMLPSSIK